MQLFHLQLLQTQAAHVSLAWIVLKVPLKRLDVIQLFTLISTFLFSEVYNPLVLEHSRFPFLPMMATSVVCACWIVLCWIRCFYEIMKDLSLKENGKHK